MAVENRRLLKFHRNMPIIRFIDLPEAEYMNNHQGQEAT